MTRVTLIDGSIDDVDDEELEAAAEMFDRLHTKTLNRRKTTMARLTILYDLKTSDALWREILIAKGYKDVYCSWDIEPVNDSVKLTLDWYNQDWSCTHLETDLRKLTFSNTFEGIEKITQHLTALPDEHVARDQALLRDYAKIKERIDASHLSDRLKAEAQALMDVMTTNILPPPAAS